MNTKTVAYIVIALSIGALFGTALGSAILDDPSAFSLGVFVGAIFGPITGNYPSAYSLLVIGIALSSLLAGWLIATTVREKNVNLH